MLSTGLTAGMVDHQVRSGVVLRSNHALYQKTTSTWGRGEGGGVDLLDRKVDYYAGERAFHKYWNKCFFALIDRMLVSAYILYQENTSDIPPLTRYKFMCAAVKSCVVSLLMSLKLTHHNKASTRCSSYRGRRKRTVSFVPIVLCLEGEREAAHSARGVVLGWMLDVSIN